MTELTEDRIREIIREELYRHRAIGILEKRGLSTSDAASTRKVIKVLDALAEWSPWKKGKLDLSYFGDKVD